MIDVLEELIEKYLDWSAHTDDYTEKTVLEEVIDDLKAALRNGR